MKSNYEKVSPFEMFGPGRTERGRAAIFRAMKSACRDQERVLEEARKLGLSKK